MITKPELSGEAGQGPPAIKHANGQTVEELDTQRECCRVES